MKPREAGNHAHVPSFSHRFKEFAAERETWNGKPGLACNQCSTSLLADSCGLAVLVGYQIQGNDRAEKLADEATITGGLRL